eukprot:4569753-Prymnesium_polylepis.2
MEAVREVGGAQTDGDADSRVARHADVASHLKEGQPAGNAVGGRAPRVVFARRVVGAVDRQFEVYLLLSDDMLLLLERDDHLSFRDAAEGLGEDGQDAPLHGHVGCKVNVGRRRQRIRAGVASTMRGGGIAAGEHRRVGACGAATANRQQCNGAGVHIFRVGTREGAGVGK